MSSKVMINWDSQEPISSSESYLCASNNRLSLALNSEVRVFCQMSIFSECKALSHASSDRIHVYSLGSSLIIFSSFLFFRSLVKVNINRNQKRKTDTFDVVYFYSLIFLEY